MFSFALLIVSGIVFLGYHRAKEHVLVDAEVLLRTVSNYKTYQLTSWINERLADANALSSNTNLIASINSLVVNPQDHNAAEFIKTRCEAYLKFKGYESIFLIDLKGNPILEYPGGLETISQSTRNEVLSSLNSSQATVSEFTYCEYHQERHLDVCVPIFKTYSTRQDPVAILVFRTNSAEFLKQTITKWPQPTDSAYGLLSKVENDTVTVLSTPVPNGAESGINSIPLSEEQRALVPVDASVQGLSVSKDSKGLKSIMYSVPVNISNWYLTLIISYEEVHRPVKGLVIRYISLGGLILCVICFFIFVVLMQIRKQELIVQQKFEMEKQALIHHFDYVVMFANDAIILSDKDDRIVEFNERALKLYGYEAEEFKQLKTSILVPHDRREIHTASDLQQGIVYETEHICRNGVRIPVEVSIHSIEIQQEFYIQRIVRDIRERKRAEAEKIQLHQELQKTLQDMEDKMAENSLQLKNANQELEAFNYTVSHDLKAPLRSISGFSEALLESYETDLAPQAKDYLNRIYKATMNMGGLIDDLLKLSRVGQKVMEKQNLELESEIRRIISRTQEHYPDWHGEIKLDVTGTLPADPKLFELAVNNAITNAFKFSSKVVNPHLRVSSYNENNMMILCFEDNGEGFDMKYVEKLFHPFQRLHQVEEYPGSGIGLSIIRRVMDKHDGKAWIESEKSIGTKLYLSFMK